MGLSFENMAAFLGKAAEGLALLEVEATDVLEATANAIADDARSLAPVGSGEEDTPGELADSITVTRGANKVDIDVGVPYAVHVEYGTSKMPAEPFFQPALSAAKLVRR